MATIKLVPSTYSVSNSTVTVSNPDNMYTDTSSTNYATITHTTSGTTSYYLYLKGFNVNDVPDNATVSSIVIRIRGYESGLATSTSYAPRLYNNTSTITGASAASSNFGTSTNTITVPYTGTWATLKGYGANLGIRLTVRRNSRNTQCYIYVYGAEIEVTYTVPVQYSVTIQNGTSATVEASDTAPYEGDDVIISTDTISGLTFTDNGTNVTSQFTQATGGTISQVASGTLDKTFSDSGGAFYISSTNSTTQYLEYAIGHTAENPGNSGTQNTYVKGSASGNSTTGDAIYSFDFGSIPSSATITNVEVKCYGAVEDSSQSTSHADITLYSGNTAKSTTQKFTSTNNSIITISSPGTWTATELHNAKLHFKLGYYGGRLFGITWTVTYTVSGYVYTISSIATNHVIVVTSSGSQATIYYKNNGSWVAAVTVYKKVNGSWVQQTNLSNVFDENTNYVKG